MEKTLKQMRWTSTITDEGFKIYSKVSEPQENKCIALYLDRFVSGRQ